MVDLAALEAAAERRVGSSPTWGTILKHIKDKLGTVCRRNASFSVLQYGHASVVEWNTQQI